MVLLTVCDARDPVNLEGVTQCGPRGLSLDNCSFTYDFYNVTETEYVTEVFHSGRKRREDQMSRGIWDKVQMGKALVHKSEGSPFYGLKMTDKKEDYFLSAYYNEIKTVGDFLEFIRIVNDNHLDFNLSDDDYGFLADHIIYKYVVFIPHQGTVKIKERYFGQGDLYGSVDLADYCNDSGSIVFIKLPIQENEDIYQYKSTTTFHGHSFGISFEPTKVKVDQLFRTLNQFSFFEQRAKKKSYLYNNFFRKTYDHFIDTVYYSLDMDPKGWDNIYKEINESDNNKKLIQIAWVRLYANYIDIDPLGEKINLLDVSKLTAPVPIITHEEKGSDFETPLFWPGLSTLKLLKEYYTKDKPKDEEDSENPVDIKPEISPAIKILPGFYNLKNFIKIFKGAIRFNNYTYKLEMVKKMNMSDNLKRILWGEGGFIDLLGKHKNIHVICDQLAPDESIFIDKTRAWRKQIMATISIKEPIFGKRITREPDRSYRFKLQNGTHNRLTFRFADCDGKPITMNSAVELNLWLS